MATAISLALTILTELPALIQAGVDVVGLINSTSATIKAAQDGNRDISDAEWNALDAQLADLRKQAAA